MTGRVSYNRGQPPTREHRVFGWMIRKVGSRIGDTGEGSTVS